MRKFFFAGLPAIPIMISQAMAQAPDLPIEQTFQRDLELQALRDAVRDAPDLRILDRRERELPFTERQVKLFKVLDPESGEGQRVVLGADNQRLDPAAVFQTEEERRRERFGAVQPGLARLLDEAEPQQVPVLIQFAVDAEPTERDPRRGDDLITGLQQRSLQAQERLTQQVRNIARETIGAVTDDVGELEVDGPFVSATLTPQAIRALARDERILFIGPDREPVIYDYPTITQSLPTTRTQVAHAAGARGQGIRIVVLEGGTPTVANSCFNLKDIQDTSKAANSHMTNSLAIIGNRYNNGACNGTWIGYAPDADVYLANHDDYKKRYEWARGRAVNVVTMSWHFTSEESNGTLHSRDRYFDYWSTRWPYPTVFTSAGNQAASSAFASGKGYNFFGVGNVLNDGDGDRCNDTMSSSSSDKNPTSTHGDREVPEIASPGSRHDLLNTSFGGTSAATPVTASIAAVLMSENGSLKSWPEAVRAIMLATANYQNADGADWSTAQDGRDGAGMTDAYYGRFTAARRESGTTPQFRAHDYGPILKADFQTGFFKKTWKAYTATTSSRIRVTFTWNSKTTSDASSTLDSDLDIWVFDPDGALVAWSSSWDNNIEFVEFEPAKTGAYEIKIRDFSTPSDFSTYYGVAWTTHYDLCE